MTQRDSIETEDLAANDWRCCGRTPLHYRREGQYFCTRCNRTFGPDGKQRENFAWVRRCDGIFVKKVYGDR